MHPVAEAKFDQGHQCASEGRYEQAASLFREVLELAPDLPEAQANLGLMLDQLGNTGEAEACYRRALELDPGYLDVSLGLGVLLVGQKRLSEAEAVYGSALTLNPDSAALWSNIGVLKALQEQETHSEICFRKAQELDPDYRKAIFNSAHLYLRQGRLREGWRALEAREKPHYTERFPFPRWQGESLAGKSLLIGAERGHGDMIQFCRFTSTLKRMGASRLGLLCHPALARLLSTLDGVDQIISLEAGLPMSGWDYWTLPLSLPFHFDVQLDSIPAPIPYLHPLREWVEHWRPLLPAAGLRVGLAWKGNPKFENDAERSIPYLAHLAPLGAVSGIQFISLQKGAGENEAEQPPQGMTFFNPGAQVQDFADLAAIMASLDLVISVDTAVAHLAGAIGKPCWVLLPAFRTDWRWMKERTDSPWYPGILRVFRQSSDGTWESVIRAVTEDLGAFAKQRNF
jgi:hypothetical protein